MDNFYFLYIRVLASGGTAVDIGFWTTNVIGRTLCEMLHRFNGLPAGSAPDLWQDAMDTGTEMIVKLPRQDRYKVLDGWHLMLNIYKPSSSAGTGTSLLYDGEQFLTATEMGDSGECVRYGGQTFYYGSFDLPLHLGEFARLDACNNPDETDEENMEEPKLYISIKTDSLVGPEFWHTNAVGRALCCTTCRLDGVTGEQAEELMLKCTNSSAETVWKLPKCHPYTETCQGGDTHVTLSITGGSPTELKYGDTVLVRTRGYPEDDGDFLDYDNTKCNVTTVNIPYILLCAIRDERKEESAPNPGDALLERMNDEVMAEERAESVRRLQEELCPPVPAKTIGEHIPDEPAAVPKYVQMVHHEDPVVHPPLPKRPSAASLPVEDDDGDGNAEPGSDAVVGTDFPDNFPGKLYRAAALVVARFVKDGTYVDCDSANFSMNPQEFVRELMPRAIAACDDYVEMMKNPERHSVALRGYRRILEIDGQPDWLVMLIEPNRVQLMLIPVHEIEEIR